MVFRSKSEFSAGERARFVRKTILGKTQAQLSSDLNDYDLVTISAMENGKRAVSRGFAELLASFPECQAMGIRPEWIRGIDNYQTEADEALSRFVVDPHEDMRREFIDYVAALLGNQYKGCDNLQYTFERKADGKLVTFDFSSDKMHGFLTDMFKYAKKSLEKMIETPGQAETDIKEEIDSFAKITTAADQ